MQSEKNKVKTAVMWLVIAAVFSSILHRGYSIKPFDFLISVAGIMAFFDKEARSKLKEIRRWPGSYLFYFSLLALFIVIGQVSYSLRQGGWRGYDSILNYGRVIFNAGVFLFAAFLVYYNQKIITPLSLSLLASPLVVLPAYWYFNEGVYIDGGRLAGLMQSPIIFGMYMAMTFIVGVGLLLSQQGGCWRKIAIAAWLTVIASFSLWAASRAAWLGLLVALSLWFAFYVIKLKNLERAKYLLIITVFAFFVGRLFLPNGGLLKIKPWIDRRVVKAVTNPLENHRQAEIWSVAARTIIQEPLGFGFNRPLPSSNPFLEAGLYGGIGALGALFAIFVKIGADVVRALANSKNAAPRDLRLAWLFATIAVMVDIFFTDGFLFREVWLSLGVGTGVSWSIGNKN